MYTHASHLDQGIGNEKLGHFEVQVCTMMIPAGDGTQVTRALFYQCSKRPMFLASQRMRVRLPIDDAIACKSLPWSATPP